MRDSHPGSLGTLSPPYCCFHCAIMSTGLRRGSSSHFRGKLTSRFRGRYGFCALVPLTPPSSFSKMSFNLSAAKKRKRKTFMEPIGRLPAYEEIYGKVNREEPNEGPGHRCESSDEETGAQKSTSQPSEHRFFRQVGKPRSKPYQFFPSSFGNIRQLGEFD